MFDRSIDRVTLNIRGNERKRERDRRRENDQTTRAGDCRYRGPPYADLYYPSVIYLFTGIETRECSISEAAQLHADKSSVIVPVTVEPVAIMLTVL